MFVISAPCSVHLFYHYYYYKDLFTHKDTHTYINGVF